MLSITVDLPAPAFPVTTANSPAWSSKIRSSSRPTSSGCRLPQVSRALWQLGERKVTFLSVPRHQYKIPSICPGRAPSIFHRPSGRH